MEGTDGDDRSVAAGCVLSRRDLAAGLAGLAVAAPILGLGPVTAAADIPEPGVPGALHVGPRVVDLPKTISSEAQQFLAAASARMGPNAPSPPPNPPLEDTAAWRAHIAAMDKFLDPMTDRILAKAGATVERTTMGGAAVAVATPKTIRHPDRARVSIHGGAWTVGGGRHVDGDAAKAASDSGCMTYSVDYRMPPDHPFPAALDDCLATYREVLKHYDPRKVVISGISSGGNLCAAVILKIRDIGLPMPGAAIILTPVSDLSQTSDTWSTNMGVDPIVTRHTYAQNALYAAGRDIKDPYLSPLYGDFSKGFPPAFLQSGTRDILLSDTVLLHQALLKGGVEAELHVWEAMPHAGFGGDTPEDREIAERIERFIAKNLA